MKLKLSVLRLEDQRIQFDLWPHALGVSRSFDNRPRHLDLVHNHPDTPAVGKHNRVPAAPGPPGRLREALSATMAQCRTELKKNYIN